ncbi:MAG: DNA primase, partial [Candidatus Nanoarchaeia archaeon]
MSGKITRQTIDEIMSRADIVEIIQQHTTLKKAGSRLKGLCPFHQEKTPSFMVNPTEQVYYCFGCHKGGNIFNFVMEKENMDFYEAAHFLADKYGVTIKYEKGTLLSQEAPNKTGKDRLLKLHEIVSLWFHNQLIGKNVKDVVEYVQKRRIPPEVISKFRLGAAPNSFEACISYCKAESFTNEEIAASGLTVKNESTGQIFDRFRNRLVFPIWDEQNKVVGFSARTVEENFEGGKYINSPETPLFKKNRLLFGLNFARKEIEDKKFAILCEGQFDVIAFHRSGFPMAVAPLGTAFSEEQAKILKRYCDTIYLALDSDNAGTKAALRNLEILLPLDFRIKIILFPQGEDPDSLLDKQGHEAISDVFSEAQDFFDFIIEHFSSEEDIETPWGKNAVAKKVLQFLSKINSPVARTDYCSALATKLKIPAEAVFAEMNLLKRIDGKIVQKQKATSNVQNRLENQKLVPEDTSFREHAEETLLELALQHGTIAKMLADSLPPDMISDSVVGKALEKVISLTLNGEWEQAPAELRQMISENPSPVIGKILV